MKTRAMSALALCLLVLAGCSESTSTEPDAELTAANFKVQANVTGMTCTGCSGEICSAVESIEGVTAAYADPKTGEVKVALTDDADKESTKQAIETTIAGLSDGKYTINSIHLVEAAEISAEKAKDIELTDEPATDAPAE